VSLAPIVSGVEGPDRDKGLQLDVVKSDGRSLVIELNLPASTDFYPGLPLLQESDGQPPLPFLARLVAVPPGMHPEVQILEAESVEFTEVDLPAAPFSDAFLPSEMATTEPLGILRGITTHALRLFPYSYNHARRTLRVYTRLRLELSFVAPGVVPQAKIARRSGVRGQAVHSDPQGRFLRGALLNGDQAAAWVGSPAVAKRAQDDWYDPQAPWVKISIAKDGLYRIDHEWFGEFADPLAVDPRSFRLFYLGREEPLHVEGQTDGRFDPSDFLLFHGRYRRGDHGFESHYGRTNVYWLTWGGDEGLRFAERSGVPVADYPTEHSFWTTAHFEQDIAYDPLVEAPNAERDHWFWREPVRADKPDLPSSAVFPGDLPFPDLDTEYEARLRVALHGFLDLGHHTVIKLNGRYLIDDRIWGGKDQGQVELVVDKAIPNSYLRQERNRLLLQVYADQEKFDGIYFNWFAIDYRRLYVAEDGHLEFRQAPSTGHQISISGFRHRHIEVLDLANHLRFTGVQVDGPEGDFTATFADQHDRESRYIAIDSLAFKTPRGVLDQPSRWRDSSWDADYIVIAHPGLLNAGRRLAEHRQTQGLKSALVSVEDLYDEFSHGLFNREAVRDFLFYAYHNWQSRPAYVVLLGDETWDYRNILGAGRPTVVPSLFYQSRGRGTAPSDFLYALVDGDDLLADFHIGRLAASSRGQAEKVVDKLIRYDLASSGQAWRNRMIYLANNHPKNIFTDPCDSLAARYSEPFGLRSVKVYSPDETPIPNSTGRDLIRALNDGALILNFNGHGSPGTMQYFFTLSLPDWDYLGQVQNGDRLPLVLAFSCLNGLFANPMVEGLAEALVNEPNHGVIAYISASAKSFVAQNNLLGERFYEQIFTHHNLGFGSALDVAKAQVLAAHSSWIDAALTMQLIGDPAQQLGLMTSADYAPIALELSDDEPRGHSTLQIDAVLSNHGRLGRDSLAVAVLGHTAAAVPETLFSAIEPPFTGERTLSFAWPVGSRRGSYTLELVLDEREQIAERDETNNRLSRHLDILEPLIPVPLFPASGVVIAGPNVRLEAAVPLDDQLYQCEFVLATAPDFTDGVHSALIPADAGIAIDERTDLDADTAYFWRVRLYSGRAVGPWSESRSFRLGTPGPTWSQYDRQLLVGEIEDLAPGPAGQLAPSVRALPFRPSEATREDGFTVRELAGSGVLATDGKYLYTKRWYNDDSTIYPGIDFFTRIGTGLNETFRTGNFGVLADSTTAGISATYHSDGYIYNESGRAFEIERIRVLDGRLDTVAVPPGLLEWKLGRIVDGHSLITSDGTHIYNVSMSSEKGIRTEWRIRVFDPAQDWALVREFTSPPTETSFTFEWTDGVLADGERLYLVEWAGKRRIRMIDAFDGTFLDEWESGQDITRIITGQYDWVNNKVWMGDLWSSAVFRYTGLGQVLSGQVSSPPIGPAARWETLAVSGSGPMAIDVLVASSDGWTPHPQFRDLSPGDLDMGELDALEHPQIRLRARLADPEARLASWSVDFIARPALKLSAVRSALEPHGLHLEIEVRNLGSAVAADARLTLEVSGRSTPLREELLGSLARGETRLVHFDSLDIPPSRARLFASISTPLPDASPGDNRLEVPLFVDGHTPLSFALWPVDRPFLSGDPLLPGQGLLVEGPDLSGSRIDLFIDGLPAVPDSTLDAFPAPPRLLWRPDPGFAPGRHHLEARISSDGEELGRRKVSFNYGKVLRIANALLYPHPLRRESAFTYVLSGEAEVAIEIYGLGGRRVCRLGTFAQQPGFQEVEWDGRDGSGVPLANGTYLYRIIARDAEREVVFRGPLVVAR